jgi:hypothetical protein
MEEVVVVTGALNGAPPQRSFRSLPENQGFRLDASRKI